MTTMIEKQVISTQKEVEKLNARLERAKKAYQKKIAIAEKLNVANWTNAQYRAWIETVPTDNGWIINKDDIKKNGAYLDVSRAKSDIEEVEESLKKAIARLERLTGKAEKVAEDRAKEEYLGQVEENWSKYSIPTWTQEEREEWERQFKERCLEDGIIIKEINGLWISGETEDGKRFVFEKNNGWIGRGSHCYSLWINRECVFTSGMFSTGYAYLKK